MAKKLSYQELEKEVQRLKYENENLQAEKNRYDQDLDCLSALLLNLQMGVLVETDTREITRVNHAFCDIFGIPKPEMIIGSNCDEAAKQASQLFADPDQFVKDINSILRQKKTFLNQDLKMKDGRTLERDFVPVHQENQFIGNMWIYRDITDRKNLEEDIRKSQEKFKTLYENAPIPYQSLDKNGCLLNINPEWLSKTGYKKEEVIGKSFSNFLTPISKEKFNKKFPKFLNKGRVNNIVFELIKKDGSVISVSYTGNITKNSKGEVLYTNCVFQDITDKQNADKALKESEQKFRTFLDNSVDAIQLIDHTGKIIYTNEAYYQLTGYSPQEMIGNNFWETLYKKIPDHKKDNGFYNYLKNMGMKFLNPKEEPPTQTPVELEIQTKEGSSKSVHEVLFRFYTDNNMMLGSIMRDISELKNKEKQLKELVGTRDKIFSIIAHDLRSPFNTILGFSELALEQSRKKADPEIQDYISRVYQSAQRSSDLLDNLLQWSRIQTGRMQFEPESINLKELVDKITEFLTASLDEKNIRLKVDVNPAISVFADNNMLETILRNVLSNAIKFVNQKGQINIAARKEKHQTEISIHDTGVGIKPENIDKIFNEESNHSTMGTKNEEGTGLGLKLCKDFVEKHGGTIHAESEEGRGTTFTFTLPDKPRNTSN